MTDKSTEAVPEAVREIIEAIVAQALSRCDSLGIARQDFYRAMLEEQKLHPEVSVAQLFDLTFLRLSGSSN